MRLNILFSESKFRPLNFPYHQGTTQPLPWGTLGPREVPASKKAHAGWGAWAELPTAYSEQETGDGVIKANLK